MDHQSEIENIAFEIFSPITGISDDEIRKLMRVRVSSKQMEHEQVAASNKVINRLKETLSAVTKGKNEILDRAILVEESVRSGWAQALQRVKHLEAENKIWKDNAKDSMRKLGLSEDKIENQRNDILELKEKLHEMDRWRKTQEDRQDESTRSLERNRNEELRSALMKETSKLKEELLEEKAVNRIKKVENELALAQSQLARALVDNEAATVIATSKDKDMGELRKSVNEREEEANKICRDAEREVSELEKIIAVTKGELSAFNHERATLQGRLDTAMNERLIALQTVRTMKKKLDSMKEDLNSKNSKLILEKELRARSEQKENEERNERIALSAQIVAMTKALASTESILACTPTLA